MSDGKEIVVELRDIVTRFGKKLVHDGISLNVHRGEVLAVVWRPTLSALPLTRKPL